MSYVVSDVPFISAHRPRGSWFAAAQMLGRWRRQRGLTTHPDPCELSETEALHQADAGLPDERLLEVAALLGLRPLPPMSFSADRLESQLRSLGPLWAPGSGASAVVIAGLDSVEDRVLVHDPAALAPEWRPYGRWFVGEYRSLTAPASFLYQP